MSGHDTELLKTITFVLDAGQIYHYSLIAHWGLKLISAIMWA